MRARGGRACVAAVALIALAGVSARAEEPLRYYPKRAQRMGVEGVATIACFVTAEGALRDCTVKSEDPPDYGFGEAALNMATLFKMRPATRNGQPIDGGSIVIPIRFRLPVDGWTAARRLGRMFNDPRIKAWVDRIVASGRLTSAACRAELDRDGLPDVLSVAGVTADPDFSKELGVIDQALNHVRTDCTRGEDSWHAAALADLNGLGLAADQQKLVAEQFEDGLARYRKDVIQRRLGAIEQARQLLAFLRACGAKSAGPGQGFTYSSEADAAKGKDLAARANAARKALFDAERSAP